MPNILDDYLNAFKTKCDWSLQVYFDTLSLYNESTVEGFTVDMKDMIIENLILNIYSSWEQFLESIFIGYMLGNKSDNGTEITKFVTPTNEEHAYNLIKNVTLYPDWADIEKVLINAENFFDDGGPFVLLKTLKGELYAIKKVRNAIAHVSKKAKQDFENLVRGKVGYLPADISPVKFVSEYKVGTRRNSPTYFEHYVEFLKNAATMLVEYQKEDDSLT